MGRLFGLLLVVAGLLYPFAVYYGMEHLSPRLFAALLGGLWLARAISQRGQPGSRWMAGAALAFCALLGLAGVHVAAALLMSGVEHTNLVAAMVSGIKRRRPH